MRRCQQMLYRLHSSQRTYVCFSRSPTWTLLTLRATVRCGTYLYCRNCWKSWSLGNCSTSCQSTSYCLTGNLPTEPSGARCIPRPVATRLVASAASMIGWETWPVLILATSHGLATQPRSTETANTRLLSDILLTLDAGDIARLALLDLSAAFDTVDHTILLQRLWTSFSLNGAVWSWFCSYLDQRRQHVCHRGEQ